MRIFDGEFRYASPAHGGSESICHLRVEHVDVGCYLVIATEIAVNPGASVTHSWPALAGEVCNRVLPGLDPRLIRWVERYNAGSYAGPANRREPERDADVWLPVLKQVPLQFGEPAWAPRRD